MHKTGTASQLWFNPNTLRPYVSEAYWTRGHRLYLEQRVLDLQLSAQSDHWQLRGTVQGSARWPYQLEVELTLTPEGAVASWDSDCTCPVGYNCKHGVALSIKAAYRGLDLLGAAEASAALRTRQPSAEEQEAARQAAIARQEEVARRTADTHLLQWLVELDAAAPTQDAVPRSAPANGRKDEHYLYLLRVVGGVQPPAHLELEAVVAARKVQGGWGRPRAVRSQPFPGLAVYDQASALDREILQLLAAMPKGHYGYHGMAGNGRPQAVLYGQVGQMALEMAARTGRLLLARSDGNLDTALRWGAPQTLQWHWQEVGGDLARSGWTLRARVAENEALSSQVQLMHNTPPYYLDPQRGLCGLVQVEGVAPAQLGVLLRAPTLPASALERHQAALLARLGKVPAPPTLSPIARIVGLAPQLCLHLMPTPEAQREHLGLVLAQLQFDYGGVRGWWTGKGATVLTEGAQGQVLLQRDGEAELEGVTRLMELGLVSEGQGVFHLPGAHSAQHWLQWADQDYTVLRRAGFSLTLDAALQDWITHGDALLMRLDEADDQEHAPGETSWFALSLGVEINGQRHNVLPLLPALIAQAAQLPRDAETGAPQLPPYVYLPQGAGYLRLPTEALKPWMAALLELVGERADAFDAEQLRLSRLDALRTTAALGQGAVWDGPQRLRDLLQQMQGHSALPQVAVPASLQAQLRGYQQLGLNWLQFLRQHGMGGILADDMGLGKTLQTLAHVQVEKDAGRLTHPALIIAPVSLMGNWQREAARFCPALRCLVLHGKERHELAADMAQQDLVIAPYSLLQRDRTRWLQAQWHLVVLDEAQHIKNANTHAAQVVGQLKTRHRLCLSGTPMENHLGEIWSLFHFLMPGFLGSQARFQTLFRNPIERQGDAERMAQLRARITPFMLRRTKSLVASELPEKVETVLRVELTGKQADLYETIRLGMEQTVRAALDAKGLAKSQITVLDALLKLRQVCCAPQLLKLASARKVQQSAKLEQLMELLPEMVAEGRRILLFSQFTSMLTLIEAALAQQGMAWVKLTGQSQNRDALIERFTSGAVPLFLISLKAGGVGLNLPQADTVIHFDPWWNPAAETQATDRAHRIGQTRTVFVYKLVAQGTIEERILALQERKAALAEGLYSAANARKQPLFTESDLSELLKPLG